MTEEMPGFEVYKDWYKEYTLDDLYGILGEVETPPILDEDVEKFIGDDKRLDAIGWGKKKFEYRIKTYSVPLCSAWRTIKNTKMEEDSEALYLILLGALAPYKFPETIHLTVARIAALRGIDEFCEEPKDRSDY